MGVRGLQAVIVLAAVLVLPEPPRSCRSPRDRDGRGCRTVWRSDKIAPSVVPKLAAASGLVFTYARPPGEAWYLTAIDYRTGDTVYRRLAGAGFGFNTTSRR